LLEDRGCQARRGNTPPTFPEAERRTGTRVRYGRNTQQLREKLLFGSADERALVQALALAELERLGPAGSGRRWWAFEGHTEVDFWLETDRLLLFVEGKRTEPLSPSTDWYPDRNQLVRNLEVVGELARGRAAAVLLVTEEPVAELTPALVDASTPHLSPTARDALSQRHLGQTSWRLLSARLDIDYAAAGPPPDLSSSTARQGTRRNALLVFYFVASSSSASARVAGRATGRSIPRTANGPCAGHDTRHRNNAG
jgi:hypothetical protein